MKARGKVWLRQSVGYGLLIGSCTGLVAAAWMTWRDWRLNPGGLFHSPPGTHWGTVLETAWSWFWPIALLAFVAALVVAMLRRAMSRNK